MNQAETAHLVERIVQTWPNGPKGRIWTEALSELPDPGRAGTAYVRLRNECEHPPTIARFLAVYRSLDTYTGWGRQLPNYEAYEAISFAEYIARLTAQADRGDHQAATELERWSRWHRAVAPT